MSEQTKISSNPGKILIALLIIYLFTHLYKITDPPNGYHAWRESDTAAVAEAFYFFLRMEDRFSRKYFIISLLLIALGALIKPTALAAGLPLAVYLLFFKYRGKVSALFKPKYFLFLGVSILVPLAWNFYARYLKFKYGLDAFYLGGDQIYYWSNRIGPIFSKKYIEHGCLRYTWEFRLQ